MINGTESIFQCEHLQNKMENKIKISSIDLEIMELGWEYHDLRRLGSSLMAVLMIKEDEGWPQPTGHPRKHGEWNGIEILHTGRYLSHSLFSRGASCIYT